MNLIQNNDQTITVPVIDSAGAALDVSAITTAEYKLFSRDRSSELLLLTLSSGITRNANELIIKLTKEQTAALRGTYYHQLNIVDPSNGQSTVFNQKIYFEPTEI